GLSPSTPAQDLPNRPADGNSTCSAQQEAEEHSQYPSDPLDQRGDFVLLPIKSDGRSTGLGFQTIAPYIARPCLVVAVPSVSPRPVPNNCHGGASSASRRPNFSAARGRSMTSRRRRKSWVSNGRRAATPGPPRVDNGVSEADSFRYWGWRQH